MTKHLSHRRHDDILQTLSPSMVYPLYHHEDRSEAFQRQDMDGRRAIPQCVDAANEGGDNRESQKFYELSFAFFSHSEQTKQSIK